MTDESSRQQHPEADLLAGFAENSLTRNERESVLSHLAMCARCREIIFLAHGVEPTANIQSSELMARPFWRRSWFPVMASAAAVVVLAVITFSWYGKFNKRVTPPGAEIAQQRTAPLPAGTENAKQFAEVSPSPQPEPAAAGQASKHAAKRLPTDNKGERSVVLSSTANTAGASGDEARKLTEAAPQLAMRRDQSELSRDAASQKALSSGAMQSAVGAKAEMQEKAGYSPRAIKSAKIGGRSTDAWDAAPASSGAAASTQAYPKRGQQARPSGSRPRRSPNMCMGRAAWSKALNLAA